MENKKVDLPSYEAINDWYLGQMVWERKGAITGRSIRILLRGKVKHLSDEELQAEAEAWTIHYLKHPEWFEDAYGRWPKLPPAIPVGEAA
jgi:hypothetical protein